MPDLNELLQAAADAIVPSPTPPFDDVQRRFRHRHLRRVGSIGGVLSLAGVVVLLTMTDGQRNAMPTTPQPCVPHTALNSRDTFVAIPRSGVAHLDLAVHSIVTVGWSACDEIGDMELSARDPKNLLLAAPDSGFPVVATSVTSARYMAFRSGSLTLTGRGSLGSTGTLEITISPETEPVGASAPSPFPGQDVNEGVPNLCLTPNAADDAGRVIQDVSFGTATLTPAPGAASRFTATQILERFAREPFSRGIAGHPKAYFGAMTDNYTSPFPKSRPLWVVVVCDAPAFTGEGGPMEVVNPAPGTSPSPGGQTFGQVSVPYDENGHALHEALTNYASKELLSEELFEVPFTRNHNDSRDGRQIGLNYRSDETCSTFDHLDVQEASDGTVYVRVWLRLIGAGKRCTEPGSGHDVVAGLRDPLGDRPLIRGVPPR
ncbi:MAG: hypothetical protein JWL79_3842 [Frankiales bacterium]|nr:hypothetical protein [Frankiales bacterium]